MFLSNDVNIFLIFPVLPTGCKTIRVRRSFHGLNKKTDIAYEGPRLICGLQSQILILLSSYNTHSNQTTSILK